MTTATTIAELQPPHVARTGNEEEPLYQNRPQYSGFSVHICDEHCEAEDKTSISMLTGAAIRRPGVHGTQTGLSAPPLRRKRRILYRRGRPFRLSPDLPHLRKEWLDRPIDPLSRYIDERARAARELRRTYSQRIEELREHGQEDEITLNEASAEDFWTFMEASGFNRRAGLALMHNGNLRAVWKGDEGDHLGVHFLGNHVVNYVIFKRRPGSVRVSRVAGNDTFDGIKRQVRSFALNSLVNV